MDLHRCGFHLKKGRFTEADPKETNSLPTEKCALILLLTLVFSKNSIKKHNKAPNTFKKSFEFIST